MKQNISIIILFLLLAAGLVIPGGEFDRALFAAENNSSGSQPFSWQAAPDSPSPTGESRPPNILLILTDDLGFNDITFYGGGIAKWTVPTPGFVYSAP